jgi:hypothetical protein
MKKVSINTFYFPFNLINSKLDLILILAVFGIFLNATYNVLLQ